MGMEKDEAPAYIVSGRLPCQMLKADQGSFIVLQIHHIRYQVIL